MCDFSRAIDVLAKLEQAFAGCEKSTSFLPTSKLAKILLVHSNVQENLGTTQYSFISITAT